MGYNRHNRKMKKLFFSLLLSVTAAFMSSIFAQSAEEAAKYGQLQEIQVPAAGKLGKFIKKEDSNVKALKLSGELNTKDLAILFSLPNITYLDMRNVTYVYDQGSYYKYEYKEGKEKKYICVEEYEFLLMCSNSLKFLALPKNTRKFKLTDGYSYLLDMLVIDGKYLASTYLGYSEEKYYTPSAIKFQNVRIIPENYSNARLLVDDGDVFTKGLVKFNDKYNVEYIEYDSDYKNNRGICRDKRDKINTLYLPNESALKWSVAKKFNPSEIIIESTGKRILNQYRDPTMAEKPEMPEVLEISTIFKENPNLTEEQFKALIEEKLHRDDHPGESVDATRYDVIREYAFANSNVVSVDFGNKLKKLPEGCFLNCRYLTHINMPAVEEFGEYALEGVTSLAFSEFTLPANIKEFNVTSLPSTIKVLNLTQHKYPPTLNNYEPQKRVWDSGTIFKTKHTFMDLQELKDVEIIIPKGTLRKYQIGNWKHLHLIEDGVQHEFSFQLDSVGALKNFLTEEIIPNVKRLTLRGVMGETDFEWIRKCNNLKYLDLSNCFTFEETQSAKERYSVRAAFWQMVAAGVEYSRNINKQKYENYEISTEEAVNRETAAQIAKSFLPETMSLEEIDKAFGHDRVIWRQECYLPEFVFEGLCWLEEIIFPQKLTAIYQALFASKEEMQHLQRVQFSEELVMIGDFIFSGASNLKEINIPSELRMLGKGCFKGCAIEKVDLSNTKIKYWVTAITDKSLYGVKSYGLTLDAFLDCPLNEFHSPRNISVIEGLNKGNLQDMYGESTSPIHMRLQTTNTNPVKLYLNYEEPFCEATHFQNIFGENLEIHIPHGMKAAWRGYPNVIDDIDL